MNSGAAGRLLTLAALVAAGLAIVMVQMDVPFLELITGEASAPTTPSGVERLAKDLASPDVMRRLEVTRLIGMSTGAALPAAIDPLRRALKDRDNSVRSQAIRALATMGEPARAAVPELVPLLAVQDPAVGYRALKLLEALLDRTTARKELPDLLQLAISQPTSHAGQLVGTLAPDDVIPLLSPSIRVGDPALRAAAIHLAGRFGRRGAEAVPALIEALESPEPAVALAAAESLGEVAAGEPAVRALGRALENPSQDVRWRSASALEQIGPAAAAALPALRTHLQDPAEYVRICSARAMGVVSGKREEAAKFLVDELTTSASPYVWQAIPALADLGVVNPAIIDIIVKRLPEGSERDCGISPEASRALAKLGKRAERALPPLERTLVHPCAWARVEAARAIHAIGGAGTIQWQSVLRLAGNDGGLRELVSELTGPPAAREGAASPGR